VAKCIKGDAQSHTVSKIVGTKIPLRGGSFMVAPFSNSTNLLTQPPKHSGKMKLQFFPIDEAIEKVLQQVIISVFARYCINRTNVLSSSPFFCQYGL
jgi:hypothetical protein